MVTYEVMAKTLKVYTLWTPCSPNLSDSGKRAQLIAGNSNKVDYFVFERLPGMS